MTTCAEWATRLAALKAAELKALTGAIISVQDGENRIGRDKIDLPALQAQIAIAQRHVDACNGIRARSRSPVFVPVDR